MSLLGLDLGTTGCKAVIFDLNGKVLAQEYVEYQLIHPRKGLSELDPNLVWESAKRAIKSSAQKVRHDAIEALSISCQGEAVIPVAKDGRILHNAIVTFDERTRPQAEWWKKKVGRKKLFEITGMPLHPMYTINKVMWFRENMPQIFSHTWKFLCFEDYLFLKLGLPPTIDYSLAARTMAFDLQKKTWSEKILSWTNLDQNLFSNVKPSGEIVGEVDKGVAKELGLGKSVIAVTGGHDQPCGALGAGILSEGVAMNATGTSDTIAVALKKPLINDLMLNNNYSCYNHVPRNTYIIIAFNLTGGLLLRWYRDTLCKEEIQKAKNERRDVYELIIERASNEPASVFILPHFVGSGTPTMDPKSRGAVLGLTLETTKADLSKAVLDSLCYEMRVNLDTLKGIGVDVEEIRIIGGGAKSKIWSQLKANIYGIRVVSLEVSEAACLGAAILAGAAIGYFSSIDSAVKKMVRLGEIFYPSCKEHERYIEKYQIYRKIYPHLAKLSYEMN